MRFNRWRAVSWPVLGLLVASPTSSIAERSRMLRRWHPVAHAPTSPASTPSRRLTREESRSTLKSAQSSRVGISAALNLKNLAAQIDGDLKLACGGLAKDLTGKADYKSGSEACEAAVKAMGEVKAKFGASASIKLDVKPPKCAASVKATASCQAKCEGKAEPPAASFKCEGSAKCDGECKGGCEGGASASASAACTGECGGKCEGEVSGTCEGKCDGKCDGKDTAKGGAACKGKCDGKCDGNVKADLQGQVRRRVQGRRSSLGLWQVRRQLQGRVQGRGQVRRRGQGTRSFRRVQGLLRR